MTKRVFFGLMMAAAASAMFGCTASSIVPNKAASTNGDGGAAMSPKAAALTCGGILGCVGDCAASDPTCPDACVEKGSADAKSKATVLATCMDKAGCKDVDCVKTNCASEINACLDPSSGGTPIPSGGAPATGSLPAELQGEWLTSSLLYNFKSDGTVDRVNDVNTGGCHSTSSESGVGTVSGTTVSIYFTTGQFKICGSTSTDPYTAKQEDFVFKIEKGTGPSGEDMLELVKANCMFTDEASIAINCTDRLSRR